jgi:hypothetical protein
MNYARVEDVIASFPHPILPTVQGEPDYQTIHAIQKLLHANARAVDTHLGRWSFGTLGRHCFCRVVRNLHTTPSMVKPSSNSAGPEVIAEGTAAQIIAARHIWEENVQTFRTYNTVEQALTKQMITVFETMYLDIPNDDMVGFSSTSSRELLYHLFLTYGSIAAVDLEQNFENMRNAWDL